jgi:hypothetical protein
VVFSKDAAASFKLSLRLAAAKTVSVADWVVQQLQRSSSSAKKRFIPEGDERGLGKLV